MYEKRGSYKFHYRYDAFGNLAGITREDASGSLYRVYVLCNSRGDVLELRNQNGTVFAKYVYDAWGNVLHVLNSAGNEITSTTNLANQNPFRYRGYYYDRESGLYYLQSRYYDPVTGRFLNADGYSGTGQDILGYNMFAYCGNNPINRTDHTGMFWKKICNFFNRVWTGIKTWAKNTFGASSTVYGTVNHDENEVIPKPSPITVKTGQKTTQTVYKHGNSSKPISVYSKTDITDPVKSSAVGLNINISKFTLNVSIGADNIGIYGSISQGASTSSFGLRANISEFIVGFESSTAMCWDSTTQTAYTNVSISGWAILAFFAMSALGQAFDCSSSPVPAPAYGR